ncbi:MAG: hypothetical protein JNK09_07575 [Prolixibacteraceae bacterium]|nr:hypothetical protein [Prolixibacteraceae bacterium]
MKQILLKIGIFFGILAAPLAVLFVLPYSDEFAYNYIENDCYNHGAWIYSRVKSNPMPIDIAFIGSSHSIHAFQEKKIEEILGTKNHLVNLGYCRYGRNIEFVILKFLLKYKLPKLVVIEVHEDEEKNSHDIFPYLAETKDLLLPPTIFNRDYFSDLITGASARLESFKAEYIFKKSYPTPQPELYGYAASDRIASVTEMIENKIAWQKRLQRKNADLTEDIQLKYPFAYLEKMTSELRKRNIPFVFVYLPDSGSELNEPKHVNYYEKIAPLFIPPKFILEERTNWMDASHFNDKGSEILSTWMAGEIAKTLCIKPDISEQKFADHE